MALASPLRSRERILVMGGPGTSKSHSALAVAKRINGHMYVLDNDNAYDRLLETDYADLDNVDVHATWDWDSTMLATRNIVASMDKDDWFVVDILSPTWQMVQDWFSENVFGADLASHVLTRRQAIEAYNEKQKSEKDKTKNLAPFDGFLDWSVINPQYQKFMALLRNCPGHVYCTAEVDAVDSKRDAGDVTDLYTLGVKPRGQKRIGHAFSTILLFTKRKSGEWHMTTVKDRGRRELDAAPIGDFGINYLMKIAGWRSAE